MKSLFGVGYILLLGIAQPVSAAGDTVTVQFGGKIVTSACESAAGVAETGGVSSMNCPVMGKMTTHPVQHAGEGKLSVAVPEISQIRLQPLTRNTADLVVSYH
ncbi:TPA: hypothetical protein QHB96_003819 [Citrobacter freundii]|uniref:hypothetical protein n=1 Tax=Citrobacter sp. wls757 TaxID=2576417 RepID=UPI0010C95089|nr:hypothetical protein [Citrobacter sp. wls757]TKU43464.1 hypothetical protein FDW94_13785 [Citrobacter sp. wls757]HAP0441325.1 hypothetical protein [Escherichia coli]HDT5995065.1 hypothetical protein [Citrobacter freundii]HDT6034488.1 hypothetical protein [Citrobacter freundii]